MATNEQEVLRYLQQTEPRSGIAAALADPASLIHDDTPTEDDVLAYLGDDPQEPKTGRLEAAGRGLIQGVTFEFGDELSGAARAILPTLVPGGETGSEAFERGVEGARERNEQARADRPFIFGASELAGFAAPAVAASVLSSGTAAPAAVSRGASLLARPVVGGAIEGGLAAAGAAEGGVGERLDDAAIGATAGGVLGGVGSRIIKAGPRVGGAVVGGGTGAVLDDEGVPLEGAAAGAALGAAGGAGAARLGRRAVDKVFGGASNILPTADETAGTRLATALEREGVGLSDLAGFADEAVPGQTVMDIGEPGGPLARLGRTVEALPSSGGRQVREFLTERAEGAPTRIKEALQRDTRLTFEDAVQTADDLARTKRANAAPLYDAAYAREVPIEAVAEELQIPAFQEAYSRGLRIAATEGVEIPETLTTSVPVQAVDYMKRGLDDLIDSRMRAGGLGRNEARVLRNRLRDMLGRVDEAVPEYAAARAQYAGDAAVESAFTEARDQFMRLDPREVAARLAELSPSEAEFYRRGALDAVRSRLERSADGRDLSRVVAGNSEMRARVRNLFTSEEDFAAFINAMDAERTFKGTQNTVLGGSPTARIQEDVTDFETGGFSLTDLLNPASLARHAAESGVASRLRGFNESTADALAPMLTRELREGAPDLAAQLERFIAQQEARQRLLGAIPRTAAAGAGAVVGSR